MISQEKSTRPTELVKNSSKLRHSSSSRAASIKAYAEAQHRYYDSIVGPQSARLPHQRLVNCRLVLCLNVAVENFHRFHLPDLVNHRGRRHLRLPTTGRTEALTCRGMPPEHRQEHSRDTRTGGIDNQQARAAEPHV